MADNPIERQHQREREQERERLREQEEKDLEVESHWGLRPLEGYAGGHTIWASSRAQDASRHQACVRYNHPAWLPRRSVPSSACSLSRSGFRSRTLT